MDIENKICVSSPYFALQNLTILSECKVKAYVKPENTQIREYSIISASEVGRHLAIIGLCALAVQNPSSEKYYYLALDATLNSLEPLDIQGKQEYKEQLLELEAEAILLDIPNKKGISKAQIKTLEGIIIADIEVEYLILSKSLFERLNKKHYIPTNTYSKHILSPYDKEIPIEITQKDIKIFKGALTNVGVDYCLGHFNNYPALPIALLCQTFFGLTSAHFRYISGQEESKYLIKKVILSAKKLIFAGESVEMYSSFISKEEKIFHFHAQAQKEGEEIAHIKIWIEMV